MISKNKKIHFKDLYIFFTCLSLFIFFFSTTKVLGKAFDINNIEISKPFEINFDKNKVIDEGFKKAFLELISIIVNSSDKKKINQTKLNEIKSMVETFSIKEEKFVKEIYYVNLGVTFNKKKIFNYLEKNNIFPSIPVKKKILFIPIIIDENSKDLLLFSKNEIFNKWNEYSKSFYLINYILPTEDLEDLNFIKSKYDDIEKYDFKEITTKYSLDDSIVALIFRNENEIRVLNRISISENVILKNQSFSNINLNDVDDIETFISDLKNIYEDYWKNFNQINTSIRLTINIKVDSGNNLKISEFEKTLKEKDLIYDFFITSFDKDFVFYQIIFNGTPKNFLKVMKDDNFYFNTSNNIWILE